MRYFCWDFFFHFVFKHSSRGICVNIFGGAKTTKVLFSLYLFWSLCWWNKRKKIKWNINNWNILFWLLSLYSSLGCNGFWKWKYNGIKRKTMNNLHFWKSKSWKIRWKYIVWNIIIFEEKSRWNNIAFILKVYAIQRKQHIFIAYI